MGYKDNFYKIENIIGYTGTLDESPTVYFQEGNRYGHITQDHDFVTNIGRETVHEAFDYRITNTGRNGVAQEYANGDIFHTSRNCFIEVDEESIGELADSVHKVKDEKEYPKNGGLLIDKQGGKYKFVDGELIQVK